jgi:hypothetical protein
MSKDSAQAIRTDNDRFKILLCRNAAGDPWSPTPRLPYVHSRRFIPVWPRCCGAHHDTALTQEQLEAMGPQSLCGGDIGDEATAFA